MGQGALSYVADSDTGHMTQMGAPPASPSGSPATHTGRRIMRGQQAAVCGLILAGVNLTKSCEIVGSSYDAMRPYIPDSFASKGRRGGRRWKGEALDDLRELYENRTLTLSRVAELFGTTAPNVREIASRNGWAKRRWVPPTPIRSLPRKQQTAYWKIRPLLGPQRAFVEARRVPA